MKENKYFIQGTDFIKYLGNEVAIKIKEGITDIEVSAFCPNTFVSDVIISNTVNTLHQEAFGACYNLTKVILPRSIRTIGENAFFKCFNLHTVVIPKEVEEVYASAFEQCYGLEQIIYEGTKEKWESILVQDYDNLDGTKILYNQNLDEIYKNVNNPAYEVNNKKVKVLYLKNNDEDFNNTLGHKLKALLPNCQVYTPLFPNSAEAVLKFIDDFIKLKKVDIIVGNGLGGLYGLNELDNFNGKLIVINPMLNPKLDLKKDDLTRKTDANIPDLLSISKTFKKDNIKGLFGSNNVLYPHHNEFKVYFGKDNTIMFDTDNKVSEKQIEYIVNYINSNF